MGKVFFVVAVVLGVLALGLGVRSVGLVASGARTDGIVVAVEAHDGMRGKGTKEKVTTFIAIVEAELEGGAKGSLRVSAGEALGHGQPVTSALHHVGDHVPVRYLPGDPSSLVLDELFPLWGGPAVFFVASGLFFVAGRQRTRRDRARA